MNKDNKDEIKKKLVSRREFLVGGGAVLAVVAFAACSNKATSLKTPSTTTGSASTPKYGGILREVSPPTPANIGWPAEMVGYSGAMTICSDTLLRGDDNGNIVPWLAESYKVADDLKSIIFNLRKGVKFHDGSDFNATVAKWNLDNYIQSKMQPYWASVDVIDDYTLRVNFTQWKNTLPVTFGDSDPSAFIVSKAAFDKNGIEWMRANPVGTGPFKFASYQQDATLKVVKNPDYWVKGKPYLDGVEEIFVADPTTQKMLMQSGGGDIVRVRGPKEAVDYTAMGLTIRSRIFITWALVPDTANADSPWANQKVREAVEYAIDKEAIAKAFGYGYTQAAYQIPPRYSLAYNPDFTLGRKYNIEKAKQLLAEAGHPDGFTTTIISITVADKNIAAVIQADLAKVGIQVNLEYPDMGKWTTYMGTGRWPSNAALNTGFPAMDKYYFGGLQWMFDQLGQSWLRTPEMTQGLNAAISSPTLDVKLVRAVTDMMTRDALIIPISEGMEGAAMKPNVMGYYHGVITDPYESFWLNK